MTLLKIALLQISPEDTLEENLEKGIMACREAKEKGGYRSVPRDVEQWLPDL